MPNPKAFPIYSIQRTYILTTELKPEGKIVNCGQRIDIPTIEPLSNVNVFNIPQLALTVIPCIELAGEFLSEFNLTFETNEGVTVLPVIINPGVYDPTENPYAHFRYVLALPRGATGVKSCRLIHKDTGKEIQHNFTFGIMPPPYNYDNMLFGPIMSMCAALNGQLVSMNRTVANLKLTTVTPTFKSIELPKGAGKQTIAIESGVLFFETGFSYPVSSEPTIHKPKIRLHAGGSDLVYTLSLNRTTNAVSIDLLTGMITVYDGVTGEIIQQNKLALPYPYQGFATLSFENFDDIDGSVLRVTARGARVT